MCCQIFHILYGLFQLAVSLSYKSRRLPQESAAVAIAIGLPTIPILLANGTYTYLLQLVGFWRRADGQKLPCQSKVPAQGRAACLQM